MELQAQSTSSSAKQRESDDYSGNGSTLRLPTAVQPDQSWYWGAMVSSESYGLNENVVYPDLSSMYPNIIRSLNISPDTIIGVKEKLDESEYTEDDCVWGYIDVRPVKRCNEDEHWNDYTNGEYKAVVAKDSNGSWETKYKDKPPQYTKCYFLRPDVKKGFLTDLVDKFMERKDEHDGTHLYSSTKAIVNALYGVLGFGTQHSAFRLFDHRLAEAVTLVGRKILQCTMDGVLDYAQKCEIDAYVTHYDTDGAGIALDVNNREDALTLAHDATDYLREVGYGNFLKDEFGYTDDLLHYHTFDADVEYFASRIYNHSAKKRYALLRKWDEGEDDDSIKITGFEAIRSDVANVTVDVQKYVFDTILRNGRDAKDDVYEYVSNAIDDVKSGVTPLEDLGVRGGIGNPLDEYGTANRTPQPIYRGSRYARDHIDGEEGLGQASKPMVFPIKEIVDDDIPKTYSADTAEDGCVVDAIAVENPSNLEGKVVVDRKTIAEKQIRDRIEPIFENIEGFSWIEMTMGHSGSELSQFM